ncbi:hypothetical protein FB45DRAFT_908325 [Roridomyces roridus]|uniref:Uncharacterized protein n=1 Tax=Roridomyces roridus TaxID=1738132 RepID=A0AAD7C2W1_9AGAR|nr:hypothetical protein FB45DRAFT_908325 [Roridomyces roridus]
MTLLQGKQTLDARLKPAREKIQELYSFGGQYHCGYEQHRDDVCALAPNERHYLLDTARQNAFATAVLRRGDNDFSKLPLATSGFRPDQARNPPDESSFRGSSTQRAPALGMDPMASMAFNSFNPGMMMMQMAQQLAMQQMMYMPQPNFMGGLMGAGPSQQPFQGGPNPQLQPQAFQGYQYPTQLPQPPLTPQVPGGLPPFSPQVPGVQPPFSPHASGVQPPFSPHILNPFSPATPNSHAGPSSGPFSPHIHNPFSPTTPNSHAGPSSGSTPQ